MYQRSALVIALLLVLVLAGCLGASPWSTGTTSTVTETPPQTTATPIESRTTCDEQLWVAFYALSGSVHERIWSPDSVTIGYTLPGESSVFFVVYEHGEILETQHARNDAEHALTADGDRVTLDKPLSGEHTLNVVIHKDIDEDGTFDPAVDAACTNDGELVQTGQATIDFDRLGTTRTGAS